MLLVPWIVRAWSASWWCRMVDVSSEELREVLGVSEGLMSDPSAQSWVTRARNAHPSTTNGDILLYGAAYLFAKTRGWQFATRVADRSFSNVDPKPFQDLYENACRQANERPTLLRPTRGLYKINSSLDDAPDDWNEDL